MFTALVASDILGEKMNLEIRFKARPTFQQLRDACNDCYGVEVEEKVRANPSLYYDDAWGQPVHIPYQVSRFQLFDEFEQRWVDLTASTQLTDYCQAYAFQVPHPWHREVRGPIPPPSKAKINLTFPQNQSISTPQTPHSFSQHGSSRRRSRRSPSPINVLPVASEIRRRRDTATFDQKAQAVHTSMDFNKDNSVDVEEFKRAFHVLNLNFSTATVNDLFSKADHNRDGRVSFGEFQRFAEGYPTLLDSLYHGFVHYWEDKKYQDELDGAREDLENLKRAAVEAESGKNGAAGETEQAAAELKAREQKVTDRIDALNRAEETLRDAQRGTDRHAKEVARQQAELGLQHEKERLKSLSVDETSEEVSIVSEKLEYARTDSSVKHDIDLNLATQVQDLALQSEHSRTRTESALSDVETAKGSLRAADLERDAAAREVEALTRQLSELDALAASKQQEVRRADAQMKAAVADSTRALALKNEQLRSLAAAREDEHTRNADRLAASSAVDDCQAHADRLLEENERFLTTSRAEADREKPLVEQEIKLREQRDALETKEDALRADHRAFYEVTYQNE